jgi:CheY-like chemotaxis protein
MAAARTTILVVDDEAALRRAMVRTLRSLGYSVLDAPDAERALELTMALREELPLVVTDFMLPRASGVELVDALRTRWPEIRSLVVTGMTEPGLDQVVGADRRRAVLAKPFDLQSFVGAVTRMLQL